MPGLRSRGLSWTTGPGARITKLLPVGEGDLQELAARVSIAERMDDERNGHAGRERLRDPALPGEAGRRAELDRPHGRLARLIRDVQVNPAMRIRPLEFLDRACDFDVLLRIEHGKRMVCDRRNRKQADGDAREADCFEFHGSSPMGSLGGLPTESQPCDSISHLVKTCNWE